MKNLIKTLTLSMVAIATFNSCQEFEDDYLEGPAISTIADNVIFANPDLAQGAVDGVIEIIAHTNSYRGRHIPFYGFNTDVEWNYNSSSVGNSSGELVIYDAKPNNGQMDRDNSSWNEIYIGIERANKCIEGIRTFGTEEPGTELGRLLGVALTYRAVFYSDLIKAWGDVPARFEPINSETLYIAKTSRDTIYKQIIADLKIASDLVPWPNEDSKTTTVERINKAFVKGLRARIALSACGYQQYPNDGVRRSNDPDLSVQKMYKIALDECRDVINSGTVGLEPTFEGVWRKLNEENIIVGGESLWEMPFSDGRGRVNFSFAVRHRMVDQNTGQARGGIAGPLPTVFYDFDEDDTRRDITAVPYEWSTQIGEVPSPDPTKDSNVAFTQQTLAGLNRWYFGKYRYEWMNRYVTSDNDDGINRLYMRYAEILLMAAEAANELEGPAAGAVYLKELRRRAFPAELHAEKVDDYVNALSSKQAMFNAIVDEHKFEFTGEMERKQALIRWNLLGEKLREAKEKMRNLRDRTGEYADVPTTLYYRYLDNDYTELDEDDETIVIYGLNRGETVNPGGDYIAQDWTNLPENEINSLFLEGVDPDTRQFWPIWQTFIAASNGKLVNDYGY
ncbi:carbohydrate-binding protein SusD [Tamlana nanhaiensis]|uniref:Carbohydrate-binding protein SusD n=1 Tax=Neotamlana nanhaiensis TaxID=1382798 RepID=A0A0D7VW34_9FLAO|nr:RagB/SusD family nutrient uptake outer membrane protein [Tamlana nanhaiensis]KJD31090.1 carbohydrate-binding protein SusD [Tamlana nanhaiensis]